MQHQSKCAAESASGRPTEDDRNPTIQAGGGPPEVLAWFRRPSRRGRRDPQGRGRLLQSKCILPGKAVLLSDSLDAPRLGALVAAHRPLVATAPSVCWRSTPLRRAVARSFRHWNHWQPADRQLAGNSLAALQSARRTCQACWGRKAAKKRAKNDFGRCFSAMKLA